MSFESSLLMGKGVIDMGWGVFFESVLRSDIMLCVIVFKLWYFE